VAYDDELAERIRKVLGVRSDVTEKKMFGGLAFLCGGRMCCGVTGTDLVVRVMTDEVTRVMIQRHVRGHSSSVVRYCPPETGGAPRFAVY